MHHEDRAIRQAQHLTRHAAEQHTVEAGAPVAAEDDEVRFEPASEIDDLVGRPADFRPSPSVAHLRHPLVVDQGLQASLHLLAQARQIVDRDLMLARHRTQGEQSLFDLFRPPRVQFQLVAGTLQGRGGILELDPRAIEPCRGGLKRVAGQ
jgi:hypothetical protein